MPGRGSETLVSGWSETGKDVERKKDEKGNDVKGKGDLRGRRCEREGWKGIGEEDD
jgi:hypothetical protein